VFLVVFLIFVLIGMNSTPRQPGFAAIEFALQYTIRFFGAVVAVTSALGLLLIATAKGQLERQVSFVLPLLAGLLVTNANWGLALAAGAVAVAWLLKKPVPPVNP
jgi:hypothetical protein